MDGKEIPIIDLFAGPGGLGEGFSSLSNADAMSSFKLQLSIEKDHFAHQTLLLRSFYRQFIDQNDPRQYYKILSDLSRPLEDRLSELYSEFPEEAEEAHCIAWKIELGKDDPDHIHERIASSLGKSRDWVLLGGPPCQAYSLAGRSRNKGIPDYTPEEDHRQYLYREYLQIIAEHEPAVLIMENVKGLVSASLKNLRIMERILEDLQDPNQALKNEQRKVRHRRGISGKAKYRLYSVTHAGLFDGMDLGSFIVKMEDYGVPQARHRLVIVGVRVDLEVKPGILEPQNPVPIEEVIEELPEVRSSLSKQPDSPEIWLELLREGMDKRWFKAMGNRAGNDAQRLAEHILGCLKVPRYDTGGEFIECSTSTKYEPNWFIDTEINGVWNHSTRSHILKDLYRYFYASCYAAANNKAPVIREFPKDLLPDHKNIETALKGGYFEDRFRVQVKGKPATTVTSHISKDGHYYIHYDPSQCRSLTVREAARIQTFPDNYFFCGPRTQQYIQVGNAVPPLLAKKLAEIVYRIFQDAGITY